MSFSTWSNLARKMQDDLMSGNWRTKSYDFDGMKKEFFSPEEFLRMFEFVEQKASVEANGVFFRTSAAGDNR